ncbi:MAG TPA: SBBP repeat-containing protein [Terriglobales bacterium]|nr:SBBP repeat-containing protein [Terriglobales bacterium]
MRAPAPFRATGRKPWSFLVALAPAIRALPRRGLLLAILLLLLCAHRPADAIQGQLIYSTYAGTEIGEFGFGLAIDATGAAVISGHSTDGDAFFAKLNPEADAYQFVFGYGGTRLDFGGRTAIDPEGNIWIVGNTNSTNFPLATNAYSGDPRDMFLIKTDPNGMGIFSRYFGGSGNDIPEDIAIDSQGNVWVVGHTDSGAVPNFDPPPTRDPSATVTPEPTPTIPADEAGIPIVGGFQTRRMGSIDMFVAKFNPAGAPVFSTYIGGSRLDEAEGITVLPDDSVVIAGSSASHGAGEGEVPFPLVGGLGAGAGGEGNDVALVRLSPAGALMFSTLIGGSQSDVSFDIDSDATGNLYVVGRSGSPDFPTTFQAYQTAPRSSDDVFFAKLGPLATSIQYATFLGGAGTDVPRQVQASSLGDAFITGATSSTDFPTRDPIQNQDGVGCGSPPCGRAVWVSWIRPAGQRHEDLLFSTYLGGDGDESAEAMVLDPNGILHIFGYTSSTDFPRAGQQVEEGYGGNTDVFYSRIAFGTAPTPGPTTPAAATATRSATSTPTRTVSPSASVTRSRSATPTRTATRTFTATFSRTPSATPSRTATRTATSTRLPTATRTATATVTRTPTVTATPTPACGDNRIDRDAPFFEDCDDGNNEDDDGCPSDCKYQIELSPRLILGKGFCEDQPAAIELHETGTGRDISNAGDVTYEWVGGPISRPVLNFLLNQAISRLAGESEEEPPEIQIAEIEVVKTTTGAEVRFAAGAEGIGVNVVRATRMTASGEIHSNLSFVISGLRLISAGSLEIQPVSLGSTIADGITSAIGQELDDPPMILFSHGPFCNGSLEFIGTSGEVEIKSLKFDLFGGLIEGVDLLEVIEQTVGRLASVGGVIGKLAAFLSKGGVTLIAEQLLDFEVSSEAAMSSQKEGDPTVTRDSVIEVTDSFSTLAPFFKGVVSALSPGLSAVQATFDMEDYCLGKASDDMLVWVAPDLERVEIRNEQGLYEEVIEIALTRTRHPTVVGMLNAFRNGEQPIELPYDPLDLLPDRVQHAREFISNWIPGLDKLLENVGVPVSFAFPPGAMLTPPLNLYREGRVYFGMSFTWNPFAGSITVNDLRLQVPIPRLPLVTSWSLPIPPNPPTPVAAVDGSFGTLTGTRRGNGQLAVDVCVPFFTSGFTDDINSLRVVGRDLLVAGVKYEDVDGDGHRANDEPGLGGWTIEALAGGNVVGSAVTQPDGYFQMAIPGERFEGVSSLTLREQMQPGWFATEPSGGVRSGIALDFDTVQFQNFGNFRDITISGRKLDDRNGNAIQDSGEPSLSGWTIEFRDTRGRLRRATTAADGSYSFTVSFDDFQGAGQATLAEVLQPGWSQVFPFGGGGLPIPPPGSALHSGVTLSLNFANRRFTPTATHTARTTGTATPSRTASRTPTGPTPTGTPPTATSTPTRTRTPRSIIAGRKYEDLSGDGERDDDEPPLAGWTIFLDDNGNDILDNRVDGDGRCTVNAAEACVVTDAGGEYGFPAEVGVYSVREVLQPGWIQTSINPPDIAVTQLGQSYGGLDFGNFRLGSISGITFRDSDGDGGRDPGEPGLSAWEVFADVDGDGLPGAGEPRGRSDAGGSYRIEGVGVGPFVVREVERCGFVQTRPARFGGYAEQLSRSGQELSGRDFGSAPSERMPADVNGDGKVSIADVVLFQAGRGARDIDGDTRVGSDDLARLFDDLYRCGDLSLPPAGAALPTPTTRPPTPPSRTPTSLTPGASPTPSRTATATQIASATRTRTATGSPAPTASPTRTRTATPAATATRTATAVATSTASPAAPAVLCSTLSPPLAIPDGDIIGVSDALVFSGNLAIVDVDLRLEIDHTFVGDLIVELTHHGSGRSAVILENPGSPPLDLGCPGDDVAATFDDEATAAAHDVCNSTPPAIGGRARSLQSLAVFDGVAPGGRWELLVIDSTGVDSGALVRWCLEIRTGGTSAPTPTPPAPGSCCQPQPSAGCASSLCSTCVCEDLGDEFCCTTEWDDNCVDLANFECSDACNCP